VVSDVYSLAAVLYELLTGTNPHRFANRTLLEIERTICEQPVVRPSRAAADKAFARRLSGDLDTILFRALDKAPERRYPTVEEFAADLQRHLSNVPVKAGEAAP
jgi:serine/threonine protein kinase